MNYKFKPSHIVPACLFVVAVLYGGSKPPASTNTPPDFISGDSTNSVPDDASSPTNQPPPVLMASRPRLVMSAPPQTQTENEPSAIHNSSFILQNSWNTRGAYCDWLHITFPDGFAFPSGTNLLTGVTLMAYGTLRQTLKDPTPIAALPREVSIEPDVSSVSYGLTPSNSFLFSWSNVCVDRSATNRVDASIELFRNGDLAITTTPLSTPTPPTYTYLPAVPPEGFVGQGQDTNWLAAAFSPTDYAAITNRGYARWLDEDYVGYNEENGHCRGTVTVHAMPPNGQPCYLVCGPHKMVVTEPGDYDFPVEVLTDIHIQTYPTAVPVSFSYDEGYYPDEDDYVPLLFSPLNQSNNPNNLNNTNNQMPLLVSPSPTEINTHIIPSVHLSPSVIDFANAAGTHISIWCNIAGAAWRYYTTGDIEIRFNSRHDAEVLSAAGSYWATLDVVEDGHEECRGQVQLLPPGYLDNWDPDPDHTLTNCYEQESSTNTTTNGSTP